MNAALRLRRQCCCCCCVLFGMLLLQYLLVFPTTAEALQHFSDNNNVDSCFVFCATRINDVAFTISTEESDDCNCNNNVVSRILETTQLQVEVRPKNRRVDNEGEPEPEDDDMRSRTDSPTSVNEPIDDTFSPRPVPPGGGDEVPTSSPIEVTTTTSPTTTDGEGEETPKPVPADDTISPQPTVAPIPPVPTISPKPTKVPSSDSTEAPNISLQPTEMMVPVTIPTLSPKPITTPPSTLAPMDAVEDTTTAPTTRPEEDENYNDDYDGEEDYNNPPSDTEVSNPETAAKSGNNNDSNMSGGGKFGIILLVGIVVGVLIIGYVSIQKRLRSTYRGSYSSTNGMNHGSGETELGLWESDSRRHRDNDDDGLL